MTTCKYKISITDLETRGGVAKLERDGHDRHTIHKALYEHTKGAKQSERTEIMSKLHDRTKPC
jgi:hypothetical protein